MSGTTIGTAAATARIALSAGYVVAGIAGLAAIGVFISTLTESAPGASIAAVAIAVISQILDGLSSTADLGPYGLARFVEGRSLVGEHPYGSLWR